MDVTRRTQQLASALNVIGMIASPGGVKALLQGAPASRTHTECRRAVALVSRMTESFDGALVDEAKSHLGKLREALDQDDATRARLHAAAALKALGFGLAPTSRGPARAKKTRRPTSRRATKRGR